MAAVPSSTQIPSGLSVSIPAFPTTEETALELLQSLYLGTGIVSDFNIGSIVRTLSESIGSVDEQEGISIQALALQALVYSAYNAFGVSPLPASSAVGSVTFSTTNSQPLPPGQSVLIPINTIVQTAGGTSFQTTSAVTLVSGNVSISVPVQSVQTGSTTNVPANAVIEVLTGLTYPLTVTNPLPLTGGSNAETPAQTQSRFLALIASIGLCSPIAIAGAVIGVAYGQESCRYAVCFEPWIQQILNNQTPTSGFVVYVDSGSGSASQNLLNAVSLYLSSGVGVNTAGDSIGNNLGYRPAGVPFCYDNETEILTKNGWKFFKDLHNNDSVATLNPNNHYLEYQSIQKYFEYDYLGPMVLIETDMVNLCVTPNHNLYCCSRYYQRNGKDSREDIKHWKFVPADKFKGQYLKCDCRWQGEEKEFYEFADYKIPMDLWLEFLGYFISEGCTSYCSYPRRSDSIYTRKKNGWKQICRMGTIVQKYVTKICQYNKENYQKIKECLSKLPFHCCISKNGHDFLFFNKALYEELKPLGKAPDKYIPQYALECSAPQLRILYDALCLGDGRIRDNFVKSTEYTTTSEILAGQVQELALKIGYSANIYRTKVAGKQFVFNGYNCVHNYDELIVGIHKIQGLTPRIVDTPNAKKYIQYAGQVYCITVPNHIVYVRRNGKPMWCGNSVSGVVPVSASVDVNASASNASIASAIQSAIDQAIISYFDSLNFGDTAELTQVTAQISNVTYGQLTSLSVSLLNGVGSNVTTVSALTYERVILASTSIIVT